MAETELERLKRRLFEDNGIRNIHVDWTAEGRALPPEEKARVLNEALDAIAAGDYEDMDDRG